MIDEYRASSAATYCVGGRSAQRALRWTVAVAVVSILHFGPAAAQQTAATAQPDQADAGGLQEVVVTARFRNENLQSTPLSITAITAEDIAQRQFTSINDIGNSIPNAYFRQPTSNYGPTETIGLRGFTQTDFSYAFEPTVGFYIDDVYQGTLTGSSFDLGDIERVEVLNGPQGTLFGKNTLGGAIRLITLKPKGDDTGSVEATYGSHHRVDLKGSGDFSLIDDKLFMRVSGVSRTQDGIGKYLDYTCEMKAQGQPASVYGTLPESTDARQGNGCALGGLGGFNHQAARVQLRYLPTSDLEINVSADYVKQADQPPMQTLLTGYGGASDAINNVYSGAVVFPKFGFNYTNNPHLISPSPWDNYASYGDAVTGQTYDATQRYDEYSYSLTADYTINDKLHAKFISAYRQYQTDWINDSDLTPFGLIQTFYEQNHRQTQDELQLTGTSLADRLDWTVGAFYYNSRDRAYNTSNFDGFAFLGILPQVVANDGYTDNNQSAFVHLNYKLTDKWSISGGWRYTDEFKTNLFQHYGQFVFPAPASFTAKRGDWNGDIDYQLTPEIFLYAEAASGFTSPGFNPRISTVGQLKPVSGQEAVNYEVGAKTDWLDHRLRVNASVFYEDWRKYLDLTLGEQCAAATNPNPGAFFQSGTVCPAGTDLAGTRGISPWFLYTTIPAYEEGAELQVFASPIDNLNVNFTLGWLHFFSKISDPTKAGYIDDSVRAQPELNMSGGVQYAWRLGTGATLTPRIDWAYQGYTTNGSTTLPQKSPDDINPGYSLFNARLGYQPQSGKWEISVQGTNLMNKFYWQQLGAATTDITTPGVNGGGPTITGYSPAVARVGTPGMPRMWSVTFRKNFL